MRMEEKRLRYPTVLLASASDSSGSAGLQADIRTCSSLRVYTLTTLTAVTAQNTSAVKDCLCIDAQLIRLQADCAIAQIHPDAVKIGLAPSADALHSIKDIIIAHKLKNVVLDPVIAASAGSTFCAEMDAWHAALNDLLPYVDILTPNLPEFEYLSGCKYTTHTECVIAMREYLLKTRCRSILLKGGHGDNSTHTQDIYLDVIHPAPYLITAERIDSPNMRGTGCTLSSAIAAYLARGYSRCKAIINAHEYLQHAIRAGRSYDFDITGGSVHHFND